MHIFRQINKTLITEGHPFRFWDIHRVSRNKPPQDICWEESSLWGHQSRKSSQECSCAPPIKHHRSIYHWKCTKRVCVKNILFSYWNGICFPIYILKGPNLSMTCHFIVPRNIIVVHLENVPVLSGLHCYVPYFSRLLLGKWL